MAISNNVRKVLYKTLSFENYLRTLSRLYFFSYRTGLLRKNPGIQYPYFLKKVIKRGDVVIDIGANLGYYTCLMARWVGSVGKIYAVEPVEPIRNVLRRNARKFKQVEILPYALGTENKPIMLGNDSLKKNGYVATGQHFVMDGMATADEPEVTFNAEMRRGSELFGDLARLDFIKCDVEGYEAFIIPEMKEVIRKHKPVLLIETGGENRTKIISVLQELNYVPYILKEQKLYPLQTADTDDILFVNRDKDAPFLL